MYCDGVGVYCVCGVFGGGSVCGDVLCVGRVYCVWGWGVVCVLWVWRCTVGCVWGYALWGDILCMWMHSVCGVCWSELHA